MEHIGKSFLLKSVELQQSVAISKMSVRIVFLVIWGNVVSSDNRIEY